MMVQIERGRPAQISTDGILRAGRAVGMRDLSLKAVGTRLGVSTTALYRHVDGRWGLERLVGESLLAELHIEDHPDHDVAQHLLSFALQLRQQLLAHPGLAVYMQTLFPRGEGGRALLGREVEALTRRGYDAGAAIVVSGAVASMVLGYTVGEDTQRARGDGLEEQRQDVLDAFEADPQWRTAHRSLPTVEPGDYVRLVMTAAIDGLVRVAPPGREVDEIIAVLSAAGERV